MPTIPQLKNTWNSNIRNQTAPQSVTRDVIAGDLDLIAEELRARGIKVVSDITALQAESGTDGTLIMVTATGFFKKANTAGSGESYPASGGGYWLLIGNLRPPIPSSNIAIRSWDFADDGVTCINADVLTIPGHSYQIFFDDVNRYIYPDGAKEPGATYVEWELTEDGNFKINLPGFDARINDYRLYVFPFIAGTTPPTTGGDGIDIGGGDRLLISDTDYLLI